MTIQGLRAGRRMVFLFLAVLSGAAGAGAQDAEGTLARLDEALKKIVPFAYGGDAGPLGRVEEIVVASVKDPALRDGVEARLLGALAASTTPDAKEFLCRMLFLAGTAKSIPTLEPLLADPAASHMARYVVGRLEGPAADEALLRALAKAPPKAQAGILNTLADRRCAAALPDFERLLASREPVVAESAVAGLGRIGTPEAGRILEAAAGRIQAVPASALDQARLACADRLLADGRAADAMRIFEALRTAGEPFKLPVLRGLVLAKGDAGAEPLVAALKGDDPRLQRSAAALVAQASAGAAKAAADAVPALAPELQVLVVRALGLRADGAGAEAVAKAAASSDDSVRMAALEALGAVGGASSVDLLLKAASATGGFEQKVARASLDRLRGAGVAGAIRKAAAGEDAKVRAEAIRALGAQAGPDDLEAILALVSAPKDPADREAAGRAAEAVLQRISDPSRRAAPLLAALGRAPADAKPVLVRLLAAAGTPAALEAARAALKAPDPAVQSAAVAALAVWADPSPAEDLLLAAKGSSDPARKSAALKGFIRLAGLAEKPVALFLRAMELASSPEEKRLVLAGLGEARAVEALAVVEAALKDAALQPEAAVAAVRIADRVRESDAAKAKALVQAALAAGKDRTVEELARQVLYEMDKFEGFVRTWVGSGPYRTEGKSAKEIFDIAYPPEAGDGSGATWRPLPAHAVSEWQVDFSACFGGGDNTTGYIKTRVFAPAAMDVQLELGSDDSIKVWLNGKLVHANNCDRGCSPKQDVVRAKLQGGWNDLMIKVTNNGGGWGGCCRIRNPDGGPLEGLRYEAK